MSTRAPKKEKRPPRTNAEWVTFAVSCVVVLAVAGLLVVQLLRHDEVARPVARVAGPVVATSGAFHVPVDVRNNGDETAAEIQVTAELTIDGETATADQTIDFLAGGEQESLTFVFDDDPRAGELTVGVGSYRAP